MSGWAGTALGADICGTGEAVIDDCWACWKAAVFDCLTSIGKLVVVLGRASDVFTVVSAATFGLKIGFGTAAVIISSAVADVIGAGVVFLATADSLAACSNLSFT